MKTRWRRFVLIVSVTLLAAFLVVIGLAVWLYKSGRLATLSQNLLQRLSGQEVAIDTIEFPAWNTVVFTNVRLQQRFPGWRLAVECPRLEAHYGLTGLLNKQIDRLRLQQPQIDLQRSDDITPSTRPAPPQGSQPVAVLPLKRLTMQQGTLHVRWGTQTFTLQQLEATLRPQSDLQLQVEASGSLKDSSATFQIVADTVLGKSQPEGKLYLTAKAVSLPQLARAFSERLPPAWQVAQGTLQVDTRLNLLGHTMRGTVTATLEQATAQTRDVAIHQATFSTEATVEADYAQQTLHLEGQARLQAKQASMAPELTITNLALSTDKVTLEANFTQQTLRLESQARLQAERVGKKPDVAVTGVALSTDKVTLEASFAQQTLHLEGQTRLRAKRASMAPDVSLTDVTLTTPWRLSYTPKQLQVTATPAIASQTVDFGTLLRASRLSLSMPLQVQHNARGLRIQGTSELAVHTMRIHTGDQSGTTVRITELQGRLPLRGSTTMLDIAEAHVQTQTWQVQTAEETQTLAALTVQGSSSVDLQRQRLKLHNLTATLPQLGSMNGSGEWHWPSHTLHDLQVQLVPSTVDTLWENLQSLIPAAYHAWHVAGHTNLHLRAARIALRPPRQVQSLVVTWKIRDGAFSSPDSMYAGEHLNGTLQATVAFDTASDTYTLQGTLTLQPFALLIGSMFPAIEKNHMTSVVTFSAIANPSAERLQVDLAGQFHDLGTLTLRGTVDRPFKAAQYDLQLHLRDLRAGRLWKTFVYDPVQFPTWSEATVQGMLNAALRLHGQLTNLLIQGTLEVSDGSFHTATMNLRGVSLSLPLQVQYPLPKTVSAAATFSPETYGRLSIEALQIGSVEVDGLTTRLALRSDTLLFQQGISRPLWGGQIALEDITAQHLLQPHRRVALRARLHNLDLQRLPRSATKLPLAGIVNGDFPRLEMRGERFETQGWLTISIAGGTIRLFNVQGSNVFSALPTLRCSLTTEQPLSLLRLTNIYPIGDMGGTIHFAVTDLTLIAGEPAAFSLEFSVQEKGGETREITLRALNNLLFTTGSAKVAIGVLGEAYRLPYKRFGARVTLRNDTLQLRGKYHDRKGTEYFMQAPALRGGVSIVNRVPENGVPFRDFVQRLKATVLKKPDVQVK